MSLHSRIIVAATAGMIAFAAALPAWAEKEDKGSTHVVVLAGDPTPSGDAYFTAFDEPMVSAAGTVAFEGSRSTGGRGIYLWDRTSLFTVAESGDTVDCLGSLGEDFDGPAVNSSSQVAFVNRKVTLTNKPALAGPVASTPDSAVLQYDGTVHILAMTGDDTPGGGTFADFDDISQNENGDVAFLATYNDGGTLHGGVFVAWADGSLTAIVRDGDLLPGTGGGHLSATYLGRIDGPWMNDRGDVAFQPESVTGHPLLNESLFLKRKNGNIRPLLLMHSFFKGQEIDRIGLGRPALNNEEVGFKLSFNDTSDTAPSALATMELEDDAKPQVCLKSDQSAGGGNTFEGFQDPALSRGGTLAFGATINPGELDKIYTCHEKEFQLIAGQGGARPARATGNFGSLEEASTGGGESPWVTFLDEGSSPGVFVGRHGD